MLVDIRIGAASSELLMGTGRVSWSDSSDSKAVLTVPGGARARIIGGIGGAVSSTITRWQGVELVGG